MNEWMNERINQSINEWMKEWMNAWMNKRINEWNLIISQTQYRSKHECLQCCKEIIGVSKGEKKLSVIAGISWLYDISG